MKGRAPRSIPGEPGTFDALSHLFIEVRHAIEGFQGGTHPSLHMSPSIEFAEHRRYEKGDDLRTVDWKALARTDRHFVKSHEREAQLAGLLLLDCSASMDYRGSRAAMSKLAFARVLLGAMGYLLIRQGDAAGLVTFADRRHLYLPPSNRPGHFAVLMDHLVAARAQEDCTTDYDTTLKEVASRLGQRSMIVLVTDLWNASKETEIALSSLCARQHDVVLFHLLSPDEIDLPFEGRVQFVGMEKDGAVDADPTAIRGDYRDELKALQEHWRRTARRAGIDLVSAVTSDSPARVLAAFARNRTGKRTAP